MPRNKNIAIFGFGKEGAASANFLVPDNQITIIDQKPRDQIDSAFFKKLRTKDVKFYLGGDFPNQKFDLVVRSPGIRPDHEIIAGFVKNGAVLTSQTKIFFDLCPCPIIGVTGTKGKGTTSTLIYEMLKTQHPSVFLGGNIGNSPLEFLNDLTKDSLVVLELSSFQLMDLTKSPHIAVVLFITSEHLDWHKSVQEYRQSKESIVLYQTKADFAVINSDFEISKAFAQKTKASVFFVSTRTQADVYIKENKIISKIEGVEEIASTQDVFLPGRHNIQNVISAVAVAKINKIENKNIVHVLSTFKGLPHRLEFIREASGVKYYNDSFSTTPETTIAALVAFDKPKILILGGSSKKSDFSTLAQKIHQDSSLKVLILIGAEGPRIKNAIEKTGGSSSATIIEDAKNMKQIVETASKSALPGDIVILSPACASFDMFKNYQDRGEQFRQQVTNL